MIESFLCGRLLFKVVFVVFCFFGDFSETLAGRNYLYTLCNCISTSASSMSCELSYGPRSPVRYTQPSMKKILANNGPVVKPLRLLWSMRLDSLARLDILLDGFYRWGKLESNRTLIEMLTVLSYSHFSSPKYIQKNTIEYRLHRIIESA